MDVNLNKNTEKEPHVHHEGCSHGHEHQKSEKQMPIINEKKIGRNDPCLCGSGKKYKKCCIEKQV